MKRNNKKDCWDCLKIFFEILFMILVIIYGHIISTTLKTKELNLETLKIAINILSIKPKSNDDPIRNWAIDVFEKYAKPKPTEEAIKILREKKGFLEKRFLLTEDGDFISTEDGKKIILE